ncbi:PseG/SpsG family protein [Streptosporangium roseum]|uniref:Spore coat polysaccharide biosynthesis protein predicted glycosyltransferase-like protein n=1 Tax=Streptosporangium roseum (strain ATCC 12428 / DSM 43021 / JCM 3005 / KCTC 9067 / NCIMB 10171 / NRRL 2505 / NI 9100) TaxID=479432 RepID=D2BBH2_STRRD|nr:spore coat polysaccharide biosynthesis protein [Streptosporangium roseum]ACZ84195.1 Spore coat polysaccharide biosynthesis protein predicted glycosyltransferase-like protein [Streptosporangium roseum DSM 43021]
MRRVGIRCDAGVGRGVGHLMRCLALAEELRERRLEVVVLGDMGGLEWAAEQLARRGLRLLPGPGDAAAMVRAVRRLALDAVVVDSYDLDPRCSGALRQAGVRVLAVVDDDDRGQDADIYLDQNLGAERRAGRVPSGSIRLAGVRYALLRDDVRRLRQGPMEPGRPDGVLTDHRQPDPGPAEPQRLDGALPDHRQPDPGTAEPQRLDGALPDHRQPDPGAAEPQRLDGALPDHRQPDPGAAEPRQPGGALTDHRQPGGVPVEPGRPPRVLCFFGGTDAAGAAPVVVGELIATGVPFLATAVTPRERALDHLQPAGDQTVRRIPPTDDLPRLIAAADLVVTAAGSSMWDLLYLGKAAALVWVAANQRPGYEEVLSRGLAAGLGHLDAVVRTGGPARACLRELLTSARSREELGARGPALVDGEGRARVADALLSPISP